MKKYFFGLSLGLLLVLCLSSCQVKSPSDETPSPPVTESPVGNNPGQMEPQEFNTLYIGNSQTSLYQVYDIVARIAESLPENNSTIPYRQVMLAGATVKQHWEDGSATALLENGQFNTLVIQGFYSSTQDEFNDYVKRFCDKAKSHGVERIVLFAYSTRTRDWSLQIEEKHVIGAAQIPNDSVLALSEPLFNRFDRESDRFLLSEADGHPTAAGAYAFALAIYCAITGMSPTGATYSIKDSYKNDYEMIEVYQAQSLQTMAAEVYLGL